MDRVKELLKGIEKCNGCWLRADNNKNSVPLNLDGIINRANEKAIVMFVGRDANPTSNNNGYFYNKINYLIKRAGLDKSKDVHISNIVKCHFYKQNPYPNTEGRKDMAICNVIEPCFYKWLIKEINLIKPKIVIFFSKDSYDLVLNKNIQYPKIQFDGFQYFIGEEISAESWQGENGPVTISIVNEKVNNNQITIKAFMLRHPQSICKLKDGGLMLSRNYEKYIKLENKVIDYLESLKKQNL